MRILLLNQDWFAPEFRAEGHEVVTAGISQHLDLHLPHPLMHVEVVRQAFGGHDPDVMLIHDNSAPIALCGLEDTAVPTVFYSVDTHHHWELHRNICDLVDYTFVAQKDYLPLFHQYGFRPEWMPLWASRHVEPSDQRDLGAVFVGSLNPTLNPGRVAFFNALKQVCPVEVRTGDWAMIFPRAEVVVNQTVKGDLNFRVFEAMMTGAALLTECSGNGLAELFEDGTHLVMYKKDDVTDAANKIRELLADTVRSRRIGRAGRDIIFERHLAVHRAAQVLPVLRTLNKRSLPKRCGASMSNATELAVRLEKHAPELASRAYELAFHSLSKMVERAEPVDDSKACCAIVCCNQFAKFVSRDHGEQMLKTLHECYPASPLFTLAQVRTLLNRGKRQEATAVARTLDFRVTEEVVFEQSERFVASLLGSF